MSSELIHHAVLVSITNVTGKKLVIFRLGKVGFSLSPL